MKQNLGNITEQLKEKLINNIENFKEDVSCTMKDKAKLVFFVKEGLDSFLGDIIEGLSQEYEIKKIIISEYRQIDEGMEWADICWFEWCDELIAYGSKLELAKEKKIICRLHSYEAFNDYISNVNWENVDNLILVCDHIKNFVIKNFKLDEKIIRVIPNGINEKSWSFKEREMGFNIAYVGYINYKKGPMLLLHTFKAIYDKDNRYKLYIAGNFQDNRDVLYYNQMVREFGLENNVIYEGWQNDLDKWLNDKDYILCTSILESQNMSVMQAMSKGIKPIIHNFVGAKNIYDKKYVWNTIEEAIGMITSNKYNSDEYRKYIVDNYSVAEQLTKIIQLIAKPNLQKKNKELLEEPLVTVGIINYNYSEFLEQSIKSVLRQNYKNIEIIIVDDCSIDDSIKKIKLYEEKHENIRTIFHKENSGSVYQGIKEIMKYSKGEYFMLLSSDDFLAHVNVIKRHVTEFLLNDQLDYVYGNIKICDELGIDEGGWKNKDYTDDEIISETFNRKGSGVIPFSIGLFKKDFYERNDLSLLIDENNRVAGDTLNTLVNLKYGWKRKYVDCDTIYYRHHDNNMTYDLENRIKSIISVMEYIVKNFSEEKYLKDSDWNNLNKKLKDSKRDYLIGINYYSTYLMYLNGKGMPWKQDLDFDTEQIKVYLQPLINITEKYMKKSLINSNLYSENINNILNEIGPHKLDIMVNKQSEEDIRQNQIADKGKS